MMRASDMGVRCAGPRLGEGVLSRGGCKSKMAAGVSVEIVLGIGNQGLRDQGRCLVVRSPTGRLVGHLIPPATVH